MFDFEKPNIEIVEISEDNRYGKFVVEPLERGYGTTLGNSLRRVMLSSMPGSAIVAVKIDGVMHEFSTIEGVVEDVVAIILNLKNVVIKNHSKEVKTAHLSVHEERKVTAADIVCDSDIEIINPDQEIATLSKGGKLDMELIIANGRGTVYAPDNKKYIKVLYHLWNFRLGPVFPVGWELPGGPGPAFSSQRPSAGRGPCWLLLAPHSLFQSRTQELCKPLIAFLLTEQEGEEERGNRSLPA